MAGKRARKIRESNVVGLKHFDRLTPLFERPHDVGTHRDVAGSRRLFFDQYCSYILLFLFNLVVTSLRGIHKASELKKVQKKRPLFLVLLFTAVAIIRPVEWHVIREWISKFTRPGGAERFQLRRSI